VAGDRRGAFGRTTGIHPGDRLREPRLELDVSLLTALPITFGAAGSDLGIGKTLCFGLLECGLLHEQTLPLVALPGGAEPNDDGPQCAGLLGPSRGRGIAGGEEDEVAEIGALHAQWADVLHAQPAPLVGAAFGARPVSPRVDDDDLITLVGHTSRVARPIQAVTHGAWRRGRCPYSDRRDRNAR
jgi:hypothetical protein